MHLKYKGFTLIELLITVSIIIILTAIGISVYSNTQQSARDTRRRGDIAAIANALESRYNPLTQKYPVINQDWFSAKVIPQDPLEGKNLCGSTRTCRYCFFTATPTDLQTCNAPSINTEGSTFIICANLEAGGKYCISNRF